MHSSAKISRRTSCGRPLFLAILLLIAVLATACLEDWLVWAQSDTAIEETARRLAERVAAIPGLHGPLRLEWNVDEKWPEGESRQWKETLADELENRSLKLTEDAAAPALAVYAEETPTQVVLTAKTSVAEREEIRMVAVARESLPPAEQPVAPVRLERQMIYESPDRILDASSLWNGEEAGLALLLYKNFEVVALRVDAKGALQQSVPLNAAALKPSRDPRAEMMPHGTMVSVQLAGKACDFSWDSPGEVKCRADKSAAPAKSVWRGDTLLTSPCDGSSWKVMSSGSEPTGRDTLQVVPDGALRESTAAVTSEFFGPILSTNGEQNPGSALVVARNLRTGNYEVYKITLACGD